MDNAAAVYMGRQKSSASMEKGTKGLLSDDETYKGEAQWKQACVGYFIATWFAYLSPSGRDPPEERRALELLVIFTHAKEIGWS
jgi:hypothetical protein